MAWSAILPPREQAAEIDIFSNKSSLILFWLIANHREFASEGFSVNQIARKSNLSVGLVHRVVRQLEYDGIVVSQGLRTNKKFYIKKVNCLITDWVRSYSLLRKTKTKGFAAQIGIRSDNLGLVPALHKAAREFYSLKSTNLHGNEFYLLKWDQLPSISSKLGLTEMDRGYETLFIKPYYSALLERLIKEPKVELWKQAYRILIVLDLCHFPLRGVEQAEVLFRKNEILKSVCPWSEIENVLG